MKELLREELTKMRSLMKLNEDLIKLSDGGYDYIEIDNDISGEPINRALLDDLEKAAASVGVRPIITTAKSDHPSEKSGTDSRHASSQAVDISKIDGIGSDGATSSTSGNSQFREKGNKLKDALVKMGYVWNTEIGNPKAILWQTNTGGNHYNHLHVSNKNEKSEGSGKENEDGYNVFGEKEPSENIGKIIQFAKTRGLGKVFGKAGRMLGLGESVEQPREKLYDLITFYRPLRKEQNTEE